MSNDNLFAFFGDDKTIFEKYLEWDRANPEFYELFKRFTLQLLRAGRNNIGSALIMERIRWETMLRTSGEPFKVNNNYKSIYARRFMRDFPQHEGCFRIRELKHDFDLESA